MKKIIIVLLQLAVVLPLAAQDTAIANLDSLCSVEFRKMYRHGMSPEYEAFYSITQRGLPPYVKKIGYPENIGFWRSNNPEKSLGRCYENSEGPFSGWYGGILKSEFTIGIYPSISKADSISRYGTDYDQRYYVLACFNEGVPCCRWEYRLEDTFDKSVYIHKWENYKEGLLHGDFLVMRWNKNNGY